MLRLPSCLLAICLLVACTSTVDAQYYGHSAPGYGHGYQNYNPGYQNYNPGYQNHNYGNHNSGYYNDPRLGYCLKNDCYGGGYGQQGGYGCGSGCGQSTVHVRVRVSGGNGTPTVQSYYPQYQSQGCNGGYYGQAQSAPRHQHIASGYSNAPAYTPQRSNARQQTNVPARNSNGQQQTRQYKYKF